MEKDKIIKWAKIIILLARLKNLSPISSSKTNKEVKEMLIHIFRVLIDKESTKFRKENCKFKYKAPYNTYKTSKSLIKILWKMFLDIQTTKTSWISNSKTTTWWKVVSNLSNWILSKAWLFLVQLRQIWIINRVICKVF